MASDGSPVRDVDAQIAELKAHRDAVMRLAQDPKQKRLREEIRMDAVAKALMAEGGIRIPAEQFKQLKAIVDEPAQFAFDGWWLTLDGWVNEPDGNWVSPSPGPGVSGSPVCP